MKKELESKSGKEIEKLLYEKRKALRLFRFSIAGSKIKNMKEGRNIKKDIARILTELRARNQQT